MQNAEKQNWSDRHNKFFVALAFFLPFLVYVITAPRTVTFEDSGLFILAARFWGISHPPGYPIFSLLAHLFTYLPISTVAFRVSLFSIVLGAGTTVILMYIFRHITRHLVLSFFAALMVAFSSTYWSQMIVAEVYALNTFLCVWFLYQCLRLHAAPTANGFLVLGLIGGLALGNHWPIFGLCAPAYVLFVEKRWFTRKNILMFFAGFSTGVLWYLLMWWRSNQEPEIAFLGAIKSVGELMSYIARSYYASNDASVLHTYRDVLQFYRAFFTSALYRDFLITSAPLFFIGVYSVYKIRSRQLLLAFLYLLCTTSLILPHLLRFEFNALNENIFRVFWLLPFVAYGYFALEGGLWLENRRRWLGVGILVVTTFGGLAINFRENNLRGDHFAEDYGKIILNSVPPNHALVASTDGDVGPVSYVNKVLGVNKSVTLYTGTSVFFKDRIFDPLILSSSKRVKYTVDFIQKHEPVYSVKNIVTLAGQKNLPVVFNFNGITYKYSSFEAPKDEISEQSLEDSKKALSHYVSGLGLNNWQYHRSTLAARLCNILVLKGVESHEAFDKSSDCQQVLARHFISTGRREQADALLMKWYRALKYPVVTEKTEFIYYFLINRLELVNAIKGNPEKQMQMLNEIIPIAEETLFDVPICGNKVAKVLDSIKGQVRLSDAALAQLPRFAACKD